MDPRLLHYYNQELRHLREVGGEFASEFPKIAGRLALDSFECADPYVERLLEGFAFLAARVQLKVDAEFPRFTESLLEFVYPHYLAPTPSMAVVQMQPDPSEGGLADGFTIPRHSSLRSQIGKGEQTACEYRTAHDVTLWPLEIAAAEYLSNPSAVANLGAPAVKDLKAGIRLRLRATAGLKFNQLALDTLTLFLRGSGALPSRLYEQLVANTLAVAVLPAKREEGWRELVEGRPVRRPGFADGEALLPYGPRSFQGYRLLHEYFAFPERFLFVELAGLGRAVRRCGGGELDVVIMLDRVHPQLVNALEAEHFALFCAPAINLFPKRADRIHVTHTESEYHVIPDRTRPLDYEVYGLEEVLGYGANPGETQTFQPFYGINSEHRHRGENAYYTLRRQRRMMSAKQRRQGLRSSYVGSEAYIALVDAREAPYRADLKELGLQVLCTNRDLPLQMPLGSGQTDFSVQTGASVQAVRCVAGPTRPRPSLADGGANWRLVSHLSLNYLSLLDAGERQGAAALRELLTLYADPNDDAVRKQIEGVLSTQARNVVRRIPRHCLQCGQPVEGSPRECPACARPLDRNANHIMFGRGVEITLKFEEAAFEGGGAFLLGAVLEQFFARYASLNTFTETLVTSTDREKIIRWPIRIGRRHTL